MDCSPIVNIWLTNSICRNILNWRIRSSVVWSARVLDKSICKTSRWFQIWHHVNLFSMSILVVFENNLLDMFVSMSVLRKCGFSRRSIGFSVELAFAFLQEGNNSVADNIKHRFENWSNIDEHWNVGKNEKQKNKSHTAYTSFFNGLTISKIYMFRSETP